MKINVTSILIVLKLLVACVVIYAMIFHPLAQSFDAIEALNYELVDSEKESDKNEEHTDKDEKLKLQILSLYHTDDLMTTNLSIYSNQASERDFVLEIPIPPPDML